jgi:hypothetical protein
MVEVRYFKNINNPLWSILEEKWKRCYEEAVGVVSEFNSGRPMLHHRKLAAEEVIRLYKTADFHKLAYTALGMFIMFTLANRLFEDDWAFRVQLVKRVIRLSPVNILTYEYEDRSSKIARELPPKSMEVLSEWLIQVFGGTGLALAEMEKKEEKAIQEERWKLDEAVRGLE